MTPLPMRALVRGGGVQGCAWPVDLALSAVVFCPFISISQFCYAPFFYFYLFYSTLSLPFIFLFYYAVLFSFFISIPPFSFLLSFTLITLPFPM